MVVHILTVGSRGDIDPLAALGAGLRDAGHRCGDGGAGRLEARARAGRARA
jgi:hypothetical protein